MPTFVSWVVAPYALAVLSNASDEHTASIFRVESVSPKRWYLLTNRQVVTTQNAKNDYVNYVTERS
jgi:hypothetical protein